MATAVIMPKQGQSVESCILTGLNKGIGDKVAVGDLLFAYETDKASFEEEAKTEGTVLALFYGVGDEIPVLSNVMVIGNQGDSIDQFMPASATAAGGTSAANSGAAATGSGAGSVGHSGSAGSVSTASSSGSTGYGTLSSTDPGTGSKAVSGTAPGSASPVSPRAKSLAEKHAINTKTIPGSGPNGRIIERDIVAAMNKLPKSTPLAKTIIKGTGAALPTTGTGLSGTARGGDLVQSDGSLYGSPSVVKPLSNIRKLIARSMYASLRDSAQLTHHLGADARKILELRKKAKKAVENGSTADITINDMVCFATVRALTNFPNVNAHMLGDSVRIFSKVNLGLAVDTDRGLMVPAVRNADDMSIQELSQQLKKVATACKKGNIDPDLLSPEAASLTVSNLGNYGVEMFTPIINLPQVAILGVNTILPRPKELGNGVYGFVPHIGLSLTYDHRAIDGGEATRFLKQIANELENMDFEL